MRYQERIYIENENSAVRNKDILNVNMSSDICVFESPLFNISGASKIDCTGSTGTSYVISTATTIPLIFDFTANTNTFTATNATFKYEIYKFNTTADAFILPPIYESDTIEYSGFSGTNTTTQNIPISGISLDGDYLVKGYYEFDACTDFLKKLNKKVNTLTYRAGLLYDLYNPDLDYYFIAVKEAETPQLVNNASNTPPAKELFQQVILPSDGETTLTITNFYEGFFVLTLNGLVLSPDLDYTYTGNVVTLSAATVNGDIVTVIYTTSGTNNLSGDNIYIDSPVVSGATDGEGSNRAYFNTTTNKFEVYTTITPSPNGSIIVMINGATLANGVDYYKSTSNPKRIILEGDILLGDVITILYFPVTDVVNGIITTTPLVSWSLGDAPQLVNGVFTLEVSTATTFNDFYSTGSTNYVVGVTVYSDSFSVSGAVGTTLYYRVKNEKNYVTICGDLVNSVAYSETIPIVIETNAINSY
jgi:hypothetical protein